MLLEILGPIENIIGALNPNHPIYDAIFLGPPVTRRPQESPYLSLPLQQPCSTQCYWTVK